MVYILQCVDGSKVLYVVIYGIYTPLLRPQVDDWQKSATQIFQVIHAAIQNLLGVLNHARLDRHFCFPAASHYPDGYQQ